MHAIKGGDTGYITVRELVNRIVNLQCVNIWMWFDIMFKHSECVLGIRVTNIINLIHINGKLITRNSMVSIWWYCTIPMTPTDNVLDNTSWFSMVALWHQVTIIFHGILYVIIIMACSVSLYCMVIVSSTSTNLYYWHDRVKEVMKCAVNYTLYVIRVIY